MRNIGVDVITVETEKKMKLALNSRTAMIYLLADSGTDADAGMTYITITVWMMQPGDAEVVADRIHELLSKKRRPRSDNDIKAPAGTLTGRWKVGMQYYAGQSDHIFYIENQDDNWVEGAHKGDFTVRDIGGMIEGATVTLLSTERIPGDRILQRFSIVDNGRRY